VAAATNFKIEDGLFSRNRLIVVHDFATTGIVFRDYKIETLEQLGKGRTCEGYRLGSHEIDRPVGLGQEQTGLRKQRGLFDARAANVLAGRDVEASFAGLVEIDAITDGQIVETPFFLGLSGMFFGITADH
jgi:hypothetical protein